MGQLDELYQDILMHHVNHPVHRAVLTDGEVDAEAYNPVCGDRVRIALAVADDRITEARFDGEGCAICMASASIATEAASGEPCTATSALCGHMIRVCRAEEELPPESSPELSAVAGVRRFPMRVKCATLPWHALQDAIARKQPAAS